MVLARGLYPAKSLLSQHSQTVPVVASMLSIGRAGLPRIVAVRWCCPPLTVIFPATIGKPTTAGRDKQLLPFAAKMALV